ncbi:MAG TPA: DUF3054 domain-containing protein [Dehalococcoidia bacterium]|nr:DUF3054 domain-containing protein [Dehalococcoidia bacterium]
MQTVNSNTRTREAGLVAGDLLCFLIFALLGLRSHEEGITASGIVRAAVPFQVGWLILSWSLGLHKRRTSDARRVMRTWVPAWAVGLIIRTVFFDHSFAPTFGVVSLLFNACLLLIWRCLVAPFALGRQRPEP